jgi:hypothetical protein
MQIEIYEKEVTPNVFKNVIKTVNALGNEFDWLDIESYPNPNLTFSIDFEQDDKLLCLEIGSTGVGWFVEHGEHGTIFKDILGIVTEESFNTFIKELKQDLKKYFKKN